MSNRHQNKRSHLAKRTTPTGIAVQATRFEGPLPHPELLEKYEAIVPGGAERIFTRFEKQSDHRMELEKTVIDGDNKRANKGIWFGFILSLLLVGGGIYLLANNKPIEGLSAIALTVGGLIYTNFTSRKRKASELENKR